MKKTKPVRIRKRSVNGMRPEYRFDYSKARTNRFAARYAAGSRVIVLDPDVAEVFTSPQAVNQVLRALLEAMPRRASK